MSHYIAITNLNKSFGKRKLFTDFNLTINRGDFLVLTGPSGSGKSTLLNMIGSLEPFDSGQIFVDGQDISQRKNKNQYLAKTVGFLFQNFALVENKTVEQNLRLIQPKNRSQIQMDEALQLVDLPQSASVEVYTLSGGEQQRIALARVLMKQCDLVLCDEPTGSLDYANGLRIMEILKHLNESGKTIILVTHNSDFLSFGNRVISL